MTRVFCAFTSPTLVLLSLLGDVKGQGAWREFKRGSLKGEGGLQGRLTESISRRPGWLEASEGELPGGTKRSSRRIRWGGSAA